MQENHKNGQDGSDIVGTSELFTITRAALKRHIISSEDYNWLKQRPANQQGGHLSTILSGPESSEKIFEEFQVTYKMFVANWSECSTHENISRVVVFIQVILPQKSKCPQIVRKDVHFRNWYATCKIGILLSALFFLEFKKTLPFTLNTEVIVFHFYWKKGGFIRLLMLST